MFAGVPEPTFGAAPTETIPPIAERAARGGLGKKLAMIVGAIVLLAIVAVVAWLVFFRTGEEQLAEFPSPPAEEPAPAPAPAPAPEPAPAPVPEPSVPPADADGDGLSDADEASLGTDALRADTDGDQLSDRDEVRVYRTDPKNADTDGDTFPDGTEVRNGYDPTAKGKRLFEVPPAP